MKKFFCYLFLSTAFAGYAQTTGVIQPHPLQKSARLHPAEAEIQLRLWKEKAPSKRKRALDEKKAGLFLTTQIAYNPNVSGGFEAHNQVSSVNDNNIAISNDGKIVAVTNSNISIYDTSGTKLYSRSLGQWANATGANFPYDPHVIYDPEANRFIVCFLDGYSSTNTHMYVGFSQTSDPTGAWNWYHLPGNVHGDFTWSDYPFPGISKSELFIPVILWQNGESGWDSEATNEIIWQIDKQKGYDGDSLVYTYYDSIVVNGRQTWNTRPIPGGSGLYGPNMFFLANRAVDVSCDTIFLFEVTNTIASGQAQLNFTALPTNQAYGIPPNAQQPGTGIVLRTNYADIHSGFYENDRIQFVGNSVNPVTQNPAIYYGQIQQPGTNPQATGDLFGVDTLDLNYPSIAYAGSGKFDNSAVINCLHVSPNTFPGTSVFLTDGAGDFSDLIRVKSGLGNMSSVQDTIHRWGDYTGIQRKYDEPGVSYLLGQFGRPNNYAGNWVARIENTNPALSVKALAIDFSHGVYPNPSQGEIQLEFGLQENGEVEISVFSITGERVFFEKRDLISGKHHLALSPKGLRSGAYVLVAQSNGKSLLKEKIIVK